jgi:hypothetical protein
MILFPKNAMFQKGFNIRISNIVNHCSISTELKEISTNAASGVGYEPTTVPITFSRGAFILHSSTSRVIIP